MTNTQVQRAADLARMATDTLTGLSNIGHTLRLYRCGLISASETIAKLR